MLPVFWEGIMKSTSHSGMRRTARILAGGLLALGLCAQSFAQPPSPAVSPYAVQLPKSNGDAKPPVSLKVDQPPGPAAELKKDEPAKPKVTIGPGATAPTTPLVVPAEQVLTV